MEHLKDCIDNLIKEQTVENIAVKVGKSNQILCEIYRSKNDQINSQTLFDMASVTKILATTSLALIALEQGLISLNDTIQKFFNCTQEKSEITVFHLLTHTIGIGYKPLTKPENTYENIAECILQIPCDIPVGTDVLYSCPAFILLGKVLEKVFAKPLDILFEELVCKPLNMEHTCFCPQDLKNIVNSNLEEIKLGVVNDYNCQHLGGVAGNAGVFSNIKDLTFYAKFLINKGYPIISAKTFENATQNHTANMTEARGLGYLYVDERYSQTGNLFPVGSIGHCGHTGQSIFADPRSGLYVIILSDATVSTVKKYGKENYNEVVQMRTDIHNAIKQDLKGI